MVKARMSFVLFVLFLLVLLTPPVHSQSIRSETKLPYFIKKDKNKLIVFDSQILTRFFTALDSLQLYKHRKVNILHIGDSHIQADFFSGRVRELFHSESQFGNGGRGFIFPYSLANTTDAIDVKMESEGNWKGNRCISENSSCQWGVSGLVASSFDSVIDLNLKILNPGMYPSNKLTLFCPPSVKENYTFKSDQANPGLTYLGYQNKQGSYLFLLNEPQQECRLVWNKTDKSDQPFVVQGCWLENSNPGVVYSSLGVNGAEASSFLRCPDLQKQVAFIKPDLVVISLGTNDAFSRNFEPDTYYKNLGALIQRIKMGSPQAAIILTTPGDNLKKKRYLNRRNQIATNQILKLADETGSAVWDFYGLMGGLGSIRHWYKKGFAKNDRVHLTIKGYKLQGDMFYSALIKEYLNQKASRRTASQ